MDAGRWAPPAASGTWQAQTPGKDIG